MSAGETPRCVVTSLHAPTPAMLYEALYCARGNGAHDSKAGKVARRSERTAATTFLAHAFRLLLACAAYGLPHALRTSTLHHTALAQAQPAPIILTLGKIAAQVKQYKERIVLHLPSACPVQALLHRVTALLYVVPLPVVHTS
jgi:hypothetical protein